MPNTLFLCQATVRNQSNNSLDPTYRLRQAEMATFIVRQNLKPEQHYNKDQQEPNDLVNDPAVRRLEQGQQSTGEGGEGGSNLLELKKTKERGFGKRSGRGTSPRLDWRTEGRPQILTGR